MSATKFPARRHGGRLASRRPCMAGFLIGAVVLVGCSPSAPDRGSGNNGASQAGTLTAGNIGQPSSDTQATGSGTTASRAARSGAASSGGTSSSPVSHDASGGVAAGGGQTTGLGPTGPPHANSSHQSSGGDSLPPRRTTHSPTGFTCNQGVVCVTVSTTVGPSVTPPVTPPITPPVTTSDLGIKSSTCLPVDSQGQTQCEVDVASQDGRPFSLGSVSTTDPSPGSVWSADFACLGTETLPGQSCVIEVEASGPVGQALTVELVVQGVEGVDVPGTPLTLDAAPAAADASPSSSTTP